MGVCGSVGARGRAARWQDPMQRAGDPPTRVHTAARYPPIAFVRASVPLRERVHQPSDVARVGASPPLPPAWSVLPPSPVCTHGVGQPQGRLVAARNRAAKG